LLKAQETKFKQQLTAPFTTDCEYYCVSYGCNWHAGDKPGHLWSWFSTTESYCHYLFR